MYFGFVEVRENEGGRPHYRHQQTTAEEQHLVKTKDGCEPKDGPAPHEHVPQTQPAVKQVLKRQVFRGTQSIPNSTSTLASTEYNFERVTAIGLSYISRNCC